jgi:hypothetical protein
VIEHLRVSPEELTSLGAPHCYVASLSAYEAFGLLLLGDWRACLGRLRVALGSSPGPRGDMIARLTASLLAVWQGRLAEAEAHLGRAEELFGIRTTLKFYRLDALRAELALATGDTGRAVAVAMAGLQDEGGHANLLERLVPLAARGMTDEAQAFAGPRGQLSTSCCATSRPTPSISNRCRRRRTRTYVRASGTRDAGMV